MRPFGGSRGRLVALLFAIALVVGACSGGGGGGDEEVQTSGQPGGRQDPLFVSIEVGGGFVPRGADFRQPPQASVYSDGRAFSPGAITLQYPGPAVLPVFEGRLTQAQIDEILSAAEEAGLADDEEQDYGEPLVADAPTTTITVVTNGQTYVTSIYALGFSEGPEGGPEGPPEGEPERAPAGSGNKSDTEARREVSEFVEKVSGMVMAAQQDSFAPDRYRVLPLAIADDGGGEPAPPNETGIEPQVKDWPFPDVALTENECVAIVGDKAPRFAEELEQANQITRWRTASGEEYELAVRPTLPHEPDCPPSPDPAE